MTRKRNKQHAWKTSVLMLMTLGVLFVVGCSGDESAAQSVLAATVTEEAIATDPPSGDEIATRLGLTEEQAVVMNALLADWRTATEERRQERGDRGPRAGGPGSKGGEPQEDPPMRDFLVASSDILSAEQFLGLVNLLTEWRQEHQQAMEAGDGEPEGRGHRGGNRGKGPFEDLDLTREQHEALRATMGSYREAMGELRESLEEGMITVEVFRDAARGARESHEASVENIVGAEVFATMQERVTERRAEHAQKQLDRLGENLGDRVQFLTQVLDLDEGQVVSVETILGSANDARAAILQDVINGDDSPEEVFYQTYVLHESTHEAMEGVLTSTQMEILGALKGLRGAGRGGRGL